MAKVWVKFCGCTSFSDVAMASDAGADAFGMIFAPSPRRITLAAAEEIATHVSASILPVAVFVNPALPEVEAVRALFPSAMLQFSGDESGAFVRRYGERAIKAIGVDAETIAIETRAREFPDAVLLFDSKDGGTAGGTGKTFAWDRVAPVAALRRVVIAGGLTPANVATCLRAARPFGVDVRSGVETEGRKDPVKMRAFVRAVREFR
jgi:phosphoribosylanthranilate isomerase